MKHSQPKGARPKVKEKKLFSSLSQIENYYGFKFDNDNERKQSRASGLTRNQIRAIVKESLKNN